MKLSLLDGTLSKFDLLKNSKIRKIAYDICCDLSVVNFDVFIFLSLFIVNGIIM